jgi:FtsP/CotA-like multicopper oxidase with cupredoxin domain
MTTAQLVLLDHVVALLSIAAWFATGVLVAVRRTRIALALLGTAVLVSLARVGTVAMLAGRGWWFAQEKALLGLPMLGAAGLAAMLIAGPRLLEARQTPDARPPAGSVVSLLTAGYAALGGFGVTFLAGYPLTWSTALVAVSLVCVAALLTARVVATPIESTDDAAAAPHPSSRLSRRRFIGLAGGAVAVSAASTGVGWSLLRPAGALDSGGGPGPSADSAVPVGDLRGPTAPAVGGIRQRHALTAQTATIRLPSGREIDAWTYNSQLPGPAITAAEGDLIEVTLRNTDIDDGVTLHWHGYDVPCGEDGAPGVTQDVVAPGGELTYRFRADQVGTYWYHTHQASHRGVRRGLYGTLVVTPRDRERADVAAEGQLDLTLAVHTFDDVVVIADQDRRALHTTPAGSRVRLRLINTDSDPHRFALSGTPFRVTAVDGRDLNQPGEVRAVGLRLPAGGRYDLGFTMPDTPVALVLDDGQDGGMRIRPAEYAASEEPAVEDTSGWPELDLLHYGAPAAVPFDADNADRHFTMVLDRGLALVDGWPTYAQTVNGRAHPSIPDQLVATGDIVRFTVVNRSLETHPWHLHGQPVLILTRDGTPSSGSPLWMDTFDVRPGEVWEVAFEATNPGIWMNHCHNLPHADQGMMLHLRYDGFTTASHGSSSAGGARPAGSPVHAH